MVTTIKETYNETEILKYRDSTNIERVLANLNSSQTFSQKILDSTCDISDVAPVLPSQGKKMGVWNACDDDLVASSSGLLSGNLISTIPVGSTITRQITALGTSMLLETGATINTQVGHRSRHFTERDLNPRMKVRWKLGQTADTRLFIGFADTDTSFLTGSNYMNVRNGFGLLYDSSLSTTNYSVTRNDGSGTGTTSAITCPVDVGTVHTVEISFNESDVEWTMDFDNGAFVDQRSGADIVASTTDLGVQISIENLAGSNKTMEYYYMEVDMDE